MTKTFYPFLIIVLSIFILLCAPALFTEGMFMDGIMYAVVAKNLAHGEGSFWFLKFSDTYLTSFHEHPPLIFGLQSICFSLFGDSVFVERFFSFFTYIISGVVLIFILKEIMPTRYQSLAWFCLLLWIVMPLTYWGAVNNLLENGMLIFILLTVLFFIKSLSKKRILFLSLSSLMLFAAFLSKGFTGLFPLALPFFMWCFDKEYTIKKVVVDTALLLVFVLLFFALLFVFQDDSLPSLEAYLDTQVKYSLQNSVTVNSRFFIVQKLLTEVLISVGIVLLVFFFGRKNKTSSVDKKWMFIFLGLGLSAVLPIMISLKQNAHYLLCALPFFALTFTIFTAPYLLVLMEKIKWKTRNIYVFSIALFVLTCVVAYAQKGKYSRDEQLITDAKAIAQILPPHSICNAEKEDYENWAFQAYLYRYAAVSLKYPTSLDEKYFLGVAKVSKSPDGYIQLPISLGNRVIFQKK